MTSLNKLRDEIHENAKAKGFHDHEEINPIPKLLMLIVSELGEALEANREGREPNYFMFYEWQKDDLYSFEDAFKLHIKDTFADELADTIIRILDLCGLYEIDIQKHIELKMKFNAGRQKLHGKKY